MIKKYISGFRLGVCFTLVISLVSLSIVQTAFCRETSGIGLQHKNNLVLVEKQPVSDEELSALEALGNDVDQVTAGHRPGRIPPPVHGRIIASDILFWTGFSLIMLSVVIYPY